MNFDIKNIIGGSFWVTLFSLLSIPLTFFLNWLLGYFDSTGTMLGNYAILIVFINTVTTFVLFGGSSVLTNFLPKIDNNSDKGKFVFTYSIIVFIFLIIFCLLLIIFPFLSQQLLGEEIISNNFLALFFITPLIAISEIVIYSLQGIMLYKKASFLPQLRIIIIIVFILIFLLNNKRYTIENSLLLFCCFYVLTYLAVILIAKNDVPIKVGLYWNSKITSFSVYSFFNTLNTYIFTNVDKIFILYYVSLKDVGVYYLLVQLASLIRFITIKLGQILLSSFSKLIHDNDKPNVEKLYLKTTDLMILMSSFISFFLMLFSLYLPVIYGELFEGMIPIFILLIFCTNLRNIGSINSMYILANEKNRVFFISNTLSIAIQLIVTLLLIESYGLFGVVVARICSNIFSQTGLFWIVKNIGNIKIPRLYFWSQGFLIALAILTYLTHVNYIPLYLYILILFIAYWMFFKISGFSMTYFLRVIKNIKS
jgi:O-antigen/teichoic acid export membrane protein